MGINSQLSACDDQSRAKETGPGRWKEERSYNFNTDKAKGPRRKR